MSLITKALVNQSLESDDRTMSVSGWLSAPVVDRDGEIIDGSAFDMEVHKANPLALWMHRQDRLPIGRWEDDNGNYTLVKKAHSKGGNGLYGTIYFTKAHPEGEYLYKLYAEKTLRTFSAGFMGRRTQIEKSGGRSVRRYTAADLHEGSCVNFAANSEALATFVHKCAKIPTWLAEDLTSKLPKRTTFAVKKSFGKISSSVNEASLSSLSMSHTSANAMADEVNTEAVETTEVGELKTKSLALFDKLFADPVSANATWNELQLSLKSGGILKTEEPVVEAPIDDSVALTVKTLTEKWNAAAPVLNNLQERADSTAADFAAFRAEYTADMAILTKAIEAHGKVKFAA